MIEVTMRRAGILPPKGLLIALASQVPLLAATGLRRPTVPELAIGIGLLLLGCVLNVWAERLFRRDDVGVCPFTPVPVLVERGPYRVTRNPMYVGLVALNLSASFLTGVLANIWSSVAFALWLHYAFVLHEEAYLQREQGAAFSEYARHVPRWLPLIRV
jgi:protein-S-isoprenylcysteine O-methyltransferase Ste14